MALRERPVEGEQTGAGLSQAWEQAQEEARGIGETIARITSELRVLSEREMDLARAEMLDAADAAKRVGVWGAVAGVFAFVTLQFLAVAGMLALGQVLELWAAALVTAGALLVIAVATALIARSAMADVSVVPRHTIKSVQEDMRWARERVRRSNG